MSFCRITGRSRGLPKPNYFPLLAPISPADAKRCCRITGKSYGLPTHHYIPVLLTASSSKTKCKITNVAGELGPHHYAPEINYGNRKHDLLPDYRYIFPILDGSTEAQKALMDMLLTKQVTEEKRYVYTVQERRCGLVFSARMEAAVRDGDVRDVMLAKDSDTVLIKTKQGRSVSMDFKDFTEDVEMYEGEGPNAEVLKQREQEELEERKKKRKRAAGLSSMKKIFETKEKLAEVQEIEEEILRQDRLAKKAKLEKIKHEKHDTKSYLCDNFSINEMRSKSSITVCNGEWKDQIHPLMETWDWDLLEKDTKDEHFIPRSTTLPSPVKITPYHCETEVYQVDRNISEVTIPLENVPSVNPLKPVKNRPCETILQAVKELSQERLTETSDVTEKLFEENKLDMLPTLETLPNVVKNIKKGKREKIAKISGLTLDINKAKTFIPGQHINTPQGLVFVPGQTVETPVGPVFVPGLSVNTPAGPGLIPGHIVTSENTQEPFFLAGQVLQTTNGEEFVCGQTIKNKDTYRFTEGQTVLSEEGLKFVPGKVINNGPEEIFVPGQTILTPDGAQFIPGQTITENGEISFTPGQNAKINNEWQFVPGQVVHQDDELHFVPGATLATPNGLKFVPGQTVLSDGEACFVPGITKTTNNGLEFIPGTTVETIDGPKFIEGQIVHTDYGQKFLPGKTIVQANGHVEFSVAKSIDDINFTEGAPVGLPIDIKTCSVSEESLYVFGHMVQTVKGIEFYPGPKMPKIEGKVVPGRLVKNGLNESRFVPGMMVEGIFVPGQIVFTENGEQFVPGQVVDTAEGPKFVPGQVVNTKSGAKFVPGQTIHTIDGPRFVPGQIIETKAGPTFIPGQVIWTEDEGSRFVPGQVVDTEEGPRFVPGRVIETEDNGVTFVPGQIVQTPEGLKFVAPDLTEGEEGLEFSVQSFVVTPEELKLLKVRTNPNDTTSTKGELTIDTNMLRQLSEAGMSIGRQVPADLPAINIILNQTRNAEALKAFITDYGLKDDIANQLMEIITSIIDMSGHLKTDIYESKVENDSKKGRFNKKRLDSYKYEDEQDVQQENVKNSIAAAVLAALVTAEQFEEINNNNSREKYQLILKSIDTILGQAIDENFVSAMYKILQTEESKETLREEILENSSKQKIELIKIALNSTLHKHSLEEEDIIEKFCDFLSSENEVLGPAFKNITKNDASVLRHVLKHISESISFIKTDNEAAETLQKVIVSAVQENSTKELENILQEAESSDIKQLIGQSIGLARVLGMHDVVKKLSSTLENETNLANLSNDAESMNILKRVTVMRKLADKTSSLYSALQKLENDPQLARTDPKLRDLVRESAALMIIPEDRPLMTSDEVPLSLLQPENSLAMEDFLFQRKKHRGALLIMKKGLQAVVPREASRSVLTGEVAYTVLDENGIRHFEPLHVFSALNLSKPIAHRFSMYSCPVVDDNEEDLQTFTGYCNISNSQRITKFGGWNRRYSGVHDRENTRSRVSSLDNTPSYRRYSSRSLTRSRSTCSKSPPKVEDVVVAPCDYTATADDEVSLKTGDIVEVLDTKSAPGAKKPRVDHELDVSAQLLDASAAKHKLAVRPKKNHPKRTKNANENGERWLVRVVEDVQEGQLRTRQGLVPASLLKEKRPEADQIAIAARRQAVVRELIETEEEFGRDMRQVAARYMRPLDKAHTPKPVFENRELLFSNFRQICEFHNTSLLEGLKYYAGEPRLLGRALLRMEREFDKHAAYCRDEPRAQRLLATDPVVNKYFQNIADKIGDDKGLAEHLKLPIQRINDYQLLLKELVKYSKRLGEDCNDLQNALELFLGVPNRATDNKFISSIEGYRGNIYKLGRLLTHDWFTVTVEGKSRERYLFLFKARVLICKVKRIEDDRSVFVLKHIIRLPDAEVQDYPGDKLKFELHQKSPQLVFVLAAHKEAVKTNWLKEIRQHSKDVVALAEHAADDLQVLSQEQPTSEHLSPEPEDKKIKRKHTEEDQKQEKKSRAEELEVAEILTRQESLEVLQTKRKASVESAQTNKIARTDIQELSYINESQDTDTADNKSKVTADFEIKSSVTIHESETCEVQSSSLSDPTVLTVEEGKISQPGKISRDKRASKRIKIKPEGELVDASSNVAFSRTEKLETEGDVTSATARSEVDIQSEETYIVPPEVSEHPKAGLFVQEESSSVSLSKQTKVTFESSLGEQTSQTTLQVSTEQNSQSNPVSESQTRTGQKVSFELKSNQKDSESIAESIENTDIKNKLQKDTRRSISRKASRQTSLVDKSELTEEVSFNKDNQTQQQNTVTAVTKATLSSTASSDKNSDSELVRTANESVRSHETYQGEEKSVEVSAAGAAEFEPTAVRSSQTVTAEENVEDEMSRYNSRSSRTSGEYSSSTRKLSSGGRYESSTGTSMSSYSRRESGSRIESGKYEAGGTIEGISSSKYESKYSSASARVEGGSAYGIESSYDSKTEGGSKYAIESNYETSSKIDSIASKYGIDANGRIEGRSSKYSIESSYDGEKTDGGDKIESSYETTSKIDSIASKYGRDLNGRAEGRSTRFSIDASYDGEKIDGESKYESTYDKSKNGESSYERKYSKTSLSNGSVTSDFESSRSVKKSESIDGKPIFTKTIEGQNIELTPEERKERNALNAPYFLVALKDTEILENTYLRFMVRVKGDPNPTVKFYRDGKEIVTRSENDRVSIVRTRAEHGSYELVIADVQPGDAGIYACRAMNIYGEVETEAKVTVVDDKNIFGELLPGGEGLLAKGEKATFTWKRDGQPFDPEERFKVLLGDDEDSLALVFQHVKPEDAGLYTCVAKTSTGNISCSAELTVQGAVHELHREPEKPTLVIEHRQAVVAAGGSAMLELQCKGYPKPNVVFKHDGQVVEPDTRHKFLYEDEESMSLVIKNVTAADAGEYQVTASNELGEDTTVMHLLVKDAPRIKKKIENQSCMVGDTHTVTVEVEGTPIPEVSFYKDGAELKSSERIVIVKESDYVHKITIKDAKLTDTGSYSVVAKNEVNQCSDFWQWHVSSAPKIVKKLGGSKVCEEKETVTFKIETESDPAPDVKWFKNKTELKESSTIKISSSGEAHSLVITSAARADAGEYSCEVRNVHGSASDSCVLNVRCAPQFRQRLRDVTASEGDVNVEFTVDVEAYPEPKVQWYLGDVEITEKKSVYTRVDNGSSHKLILKEVSAEMSGQYSCKVTNDLGSDSCHATFTVNRKPRITKSLVDMTVDAGQTLKLEVEVEGCPEPKVKWYKDGKEVTTDARIKIERDTKRLENYNLTVTLVKEEDGGEYEVRAENEMGSVSSKSTVTVHTKEVHSRFKKETMLEKEVDEDRKPKKQETKELIEDDKDTATVKKTKTEKIEEKLVDDTEKNVRFENTEEQTADKAKKSHSEPEIAEEKSFWDEIDDGVKAKETTVNDSDIQPEQAKHTFSEPEVEEEKSFWDDVEDDIKPRKTKQPFSEAEPIEQKSIWDENVDENAKKVLVNEVTNEAQKVKRSFSKPEVAKERSSGNDDIEDQAKIPHVEEIQNKPQKSRKSFSKPDTVEEKSFWDDDTENKETKSVKEQEVIDKPQKGNKSFSEPEEAETKSFWDEIKDEQNNTVQIDSSEIEPRKSKESIAEKDNQQLKDLDNGEESSRKTLPEPESVETKSFWDDNESEQSQKLQIDDSREKPITSRKSITDAENAETKSFWDENEGQIKKPVISDVKSPRKLLVEPEKAEDKSFDEANKNIQEDEAPKSCTKSEVSEAKSAWDTNENEKNEKIKISEIQEVPDKSKKSFTASEPIEEKSIWDEKKDEQNKKPEVKDIENDKQKSNKGITEPENITEVKIEEDLKPSRRKSVKKQSLKEEPISAEKEGRVFETITTFKTGEDGSIVVSKVSSTCSHGAIITGPAETHTLHKMTSKYYDDDDECTRKVIPPNKPHTTSLEVEEIASHSYFLSEMGYYTVPDHVRRGTYGIIEEPQTDSDADSLRYGRFTGNRTVSIHSVSEDENSLYNESLSREISIEDLSKTIFEIDETRKVFSKDSYVRQSSFKEDYLTNEGDEESVILTEKREKVFENDITEKLIDIRKEFDENEFKNIEEKADDVKNRIIEELVIGDIMNHDNITKDIAETTVEKKKKQNGKLFCLQEEDDGEVEALLRRSQRQRSILDDIINQEDVKAPPKLKESSMKDSSVYESLPLVFTVEASGSPKPTVRWLHDGKEVKPDARVRITNDGDLYKLQVDKAELGDAGKWQCEISNNLGKDVLQAEITVKPESELRKPIFKTPLEAQRVMQREPVTLRAVCTADPLPHVAWLLNGHELTPDATLLIDAETKDIEHGLKECVFTLRIPTGRHADTGMYTIQAKNKYGVGECSARLDILLRPEIEGLKDVTAMPYEETTFIAKIQANPIAEVQWSKDGYVIKPSSKIDIEEDKASETHKLVVKKVTPEDAGVYSVTAKNEIGEASQQAKLTIHTDKPVFTKPLQKETVKDYADCTLKVRCDGVPKPEVRWFVNDKQVVNDERHTVTTEVGGQVDSELEIKHFNPSDAGKYVVRAVSLSGEAECEAVISLAQTPPGFAHKLERQKDVDEGEPLELKAKLDGSPIPTAKWYKDGAPLPAEDSRVKQSALPDGTVKLSIEHVTPADCGAYKLVITNPNGENSALCAVAVNPTPRKPSFSEPLEDVKAVVGQPLKLQARVMAFPAPEVKWFKDGLPIRPSQAINFINQPGGVIGLSIDSCRPEDAGQYQLTVANKLGDVESKAKVEVLQKERKPAFVAELMPVKVIEGFPAKLEVKVLGHPPPVIKWTHNGEEIVPDGTRVRVVTQPDGAIALLIAEAKAPDAGQYGVIAANDKGETSCTAELSVASREDDSSPQEKPRFVHGLRETTADEGQPLTLSAPFAGNPVPEVAWTKDGQPLMPSERLLLTCDGKRVGLEINPVVPADAGVYSVRLSNPLGEDTSEAPVNVRKVYQPPTFSQKFTDLQQLPSLDAKFSARVHGKPTPEVSWYRDGRPLSAGDKYGIKRDGEACCLYVRDLVPEDAGTYKCVARNKEGEAICEAALEVVDKIGRQQRAEPPSFLKRIGDAEIVRGLPVKFTACVTGSPEPEVEWFRNDEKLFPCERIRMDHESTGLLRLSISGADHSDVGTYRCRIYNPHGEDSCIANLTYDTLEPVSSKRPISEQYSNFDKMKKTGVPMPLGDKPIISRMADRHLTLSWRPSIPHGPRFPVTYQVEMCEMPEGEWFTARTGLRSCVCDIRNLEPFRDYKFRVRVENKYGVSEPSPYAVTQRARLEPEPPKFVPYLEPGIDFRPETSPYFPRDFDIERPPHDGHAQAPRFLRQEHDAQYGVKGHNADLFWFVYGYPKPKMTYFFNDEPIEIGGRYDWSYTRNGQATLFINKMLERDAGWYEAVATNEHGQARQRVRLELAEYPRFITRPQETVVLQRRTARLEARVTGVPYPDIKWYKDWQPLAPSTRIKMQFIEPDTVILVIHDAILKDEGLYSVSARNVAGAVSSSAMLHVEESEHEYSTRIREHPPRVKPTGKPFGDFYDIGDELGRGVQGVVYHAAERLTGRNYAAKIMHGHSELKPFMKNELDILNLLSDRHLVRLHDAYEREHTLALVLELAAGGELVRDRLLRSQGYTEREIAGYVRQLLRGLRHMHDNSIAHLGLTIGELVLSHAGSDELKLCDFGLSRRILAERLAALHYGVPEYVAPEVARGEGVSYPADMWSLGIITYILLSGHSPFRGLNDRETLTRVQDGSWSWHDESWWSRMSTECRDFISRLLVVDWRQRMDVRTALDHPWLTRADKIYHDEFLITTDRLRNYYNFYRDWMSNAQCRTWFRRRPLSGAFDHPSKMVYPPGEIYTPEYRGSPEREPRDRAAPDLSMPHWDHPDWEVSATSESHYQNGPDTYLLQLRDTQFPVRLREYMKVACDRSPAYNLSVHDAYDPRTPIIRERRRFTDIMDEEIDDERRDRINRYGSESYTIRRLRHELGTRLDSYAEAQALMEAKKDGHPPFFREKPQILPIREGEPAQLSCYAVGDPKPSVQWFKNDKVIAEGQRIKIIEDEDGRSTLKFDPSMHHDVGFYKVVARNKVGQTVARTRIVEATSPDAPDSPTVADLSDTEVLLRWKQPKYDGNSPVLCYSLQYKEGDSVDWKTVAENIDHEFFVVRGLQPETSYQFRLASRNRIGWSDKGIPTNLVKTKEAGAAKIEVTKAMKHLQQLTESGQEIVLNEEKPRLDYGAENEPKDWDTSESFTERYSFISELWRGKFSIVVKGIDKTNDSVVVAKILECRPETEIQVQREFECLRRLRHERISNLLGAYQTPGSPVAALILEKLQGADILTYLSSRHDYTEQMVATIVIQILDALQYLHWRGYCHLDLQPDNVVMSSVRAIQVKLIDLGSAHRVTKLGTSVPQVGELEYKAPEVINDEPAFPQSDIWSLGVLTYIMLSGTSPFRGADDAETKQNISFVRYRFEHLYKEITQEATRFLMFVFKKVPLKRPSAEECYEHRWLAQSDFIHKKRERAVFLGNRLKEFSDEYHEKKAREASQADTVATAFGQMAARHLTRSNSIQEELLTNFSSH
ncbi:PREDICTED: muscle M-line assembly protein unc-89-like isoform X2 [Papilio xuthus]|uniref:Hemolin n=1 Tax=Papilio xuthus TaxID=66420 RepID=A0AAJ6ZN49_PAPXU|nr:PREDICTED: muscle M-line assembly protein unc-89-like isoform X2 [Papilio xuthus]